MFEQTLYICNFKSLGDNYRNYRIHLLKMSKQYKNKINLFDEIVFCISRVLYPRLTQKMHRFRKMKHV